MDLFGTGGMPAKSSVGAENFRWGQGSGVIEEIKRRLRIEAVIGESFTVIGRGRILTTEEHDSLKIWTESQSWYWFSRGIGGDLFDWYEYQHTCDFRTALEMLAGKADVPLRALSEEERAVWATERKEEQQRREIFTMAARYYQAVLWHEVGTAARRYCRGRGWTEETMQREQLGYSAGAEEGFVVASRPETLPVRPLHAQLRDVELLDHPLSRAVLSIPPGHLVYVHRALGQVVYLSARSIKEKRHYNLPLAVAGPKQLYRNDPAAVPLLASRTQNVPYVLVEGQADAIALGQLGISAVALGGVDDAAMRFQEDFDGFGFITHVAFDNDDAGRDKAMELVLGRGEVQKDASRQSALLQAPARVQRTPGRHLCRIATWPVKDAAEFVQREATTQDVLDVLAQSPTAIECLAIQAAKAKDQERVALLRRFFTLYGELETLVATDLKPTLAKHLCDGRLAHFQRLLKAHQAEAKVDGRDAAVQYEYSAGGAIGGLVWEQCIAWDDMGGGACIYAVRQPNGAIRYEKEMVVGKITYLPYPATLGVIRNRRIVLFPERAEEYGNEQQLVKAVQTFLHDYFDFGDPFFEKLAAYYVLFSWLYDCFENLPYLRALGDYGTGKTRFIQTVGVLCYRPMLVSGASTASPVFRLIDMFRGTLVMDEADFANSDADNEIIKIINVGYYKGGCVMRAEKEADADVYAPETYDVFGPKLLATRKPFTDRAVESRCLTIRTTAARPRPGIPFLLNEQFWRRAQGLRNQLLMYRLRNQRAVVVDETLANESIEPRLNQVTMALKSIIADPALRKEIDTFIAAYNECLIQDRQMTLPAIVTQALAEIYYAPNGSGSDEAGSEAQGTAHDLTMQGIAAKARELLAEIDPDIKIYPRLVSKILREQLGLVNTGKHHPVNRRVMVTFAEDELLALMQRYGIAAPGAVGQ